MINHRNFLIMFILIFIFGLSRFFWIATPVEVYVTTFATEQTETPAIETTTPSLIKTTVVKEIIINEKKFMEDVEDGEMFNITSKSCPAEDWNSIHYKDVPNSDKHLEWMGQELGHQRQYSNQSTPSIFAAYVYKTHILATLTAENFYGKPVYCRYYDCNRKEILSQFPSYVFPESTVHCARRSGAKYLSITESLDVKPSSSVPIQKRISPKHYFTVCMAPIYGEEPKFLQIVEFVEYYKLQGASFFHIYIRNISSYDRILLDDYIRTNDVEVIKMHDHYWREDFMWHHVQVNDCLHRNKYFSKWTALVDIDERIEIKDPHSPTIVNYLDTITDPNINVLQLSVQLVLKNGTSPPIYIDDKQIAEELFSQKYHNTSQIGSDSDQPNCIIRPDRIAVMNIHRPYAVYKSDLITPVDKTKAVVRHYRSNSGGSVQPENSEVMRENSPFENTSIDEIVSRKLMEQVTNRVKWIYDIKEPSCEEKQKIYGRYNTSIACVA